MSSHDSDLPVDKLTRRHRRRRVIGIIFLSLGVWGAIMLYLGRKPSIILANGSQVIYHSSSRGVFQPDKPGVFWGSPSYDHTPPEQDVPKIQRWWQTLRVKMPGWLVSRVPAWDIHPDLYPRGLNSSEFELRFRVVGDFAPGPNAWHSEWNVFVADENGWESQVLDAFWCDDGRFEHGASQHSSWLRAGTPLPRHSRTLRVRVRPGSARTPEMYSVKHLSAFTEMVLENPFYEGPATKQGDRLPITKPFRDGAITLEEIRRDTVVGEGYGSFSAKFRLERAGLPIHGYECLRFEVSDSSGQRFLYRNADWQTEAPHHTVSIRNAPWSDDPCWRIRLVFSRGHYGKEVRPEEVFRFEKLPVPVGQPIELNRSLTRNGVTLTLGTLSPTDEGVAFFTIDGWRGKEPVERLVLVHDARDDTGRTRVKHPEHGELPLVLRPMTSDRDLPYCVCLPPGAKWWNLAVISETATEVEFNVQAPPLTPRSP